jgi:biopolymer transport protein ExbD
MAFGGGHHGGLGGAFGQAADAGGDINLNLTALMDILSNLLFFLLASYSAQEVEVQQKEQITLPASTSEAKVIQNLIITVSKKQILVADVPVAGLDGIKITDSAEEGDKIVTLFERLKGVKSSRDAAGQSGMPGGDTVLLLADKSTDTGVITKVLKTSGMAGFPNVRFGVIAK